MFPPWGNCKQAFSITSLDTSFMIDRNETAKQMAYSAGGKGKQQRHKMCTTSSLCTLVIWGFPCTRMTHAWNLHRATKACLLRFEDATEKKGNCLIWVIWHLQFEYSLTYLSEEAVLKCYPIPTEVVQEILKNNKSVASFKCASKVYTLNPHKIQFPLLSNADGGLIHSGVF